ncbi:MAG: aminotransferase class I/II-fold pyridoxal phosphate-dependent enzyme [Candidatus Tritonobacter lacicola]|nr:aminotransferase class I/II-fold pyridoxal phosphate-dependent enzyme [Candidatus Tritonobacter lacicola]
MIREANRMLRLPPYLFTIVDDLKQKVAARGVDVIDLSMGNPDLGAPPRALSALCEAAADSDNHGYSKSYGPIEQDLKRAIADWYGRKFGVDLDPATEVLPLIGAKEGIAHLSLAFLNNDDIALVPSPAYPVHFNGAIMAGGILYNLPLGPGNDYKPELDKLDKHIVRMAKLLLISYPHNPTAAVVDLEFFERVVAWAKKNDIIVAHDLAYSDIVFDGYRSPSMMQVGDARTIGVEFHTMSKSYSMAGWRIGYAVGNRRILKSIAKTKSYVDFGIFRPIQCAAIACLDGSDEYVLETVEIYRRRRDVFVNGLKEIGWNVPLPKGTFYVWARIPLKYSALTSLEFATLLLEETGVAVAPGTGFGEYGEGYVRFALVQKEERLKEAVSRLKKHLDVDS